MKHGLYFFINLIKYIFVLVFAFFISLDAFVVLSVVVFKDFQAIICATQILMWFTFTTVRCVLSFSYH